MTDEKTRPTESRVVLPVDPTRRTEIDKQRVPMSARPYRLLALVKQDAVVRVQKEPDDTVMTWPHLLSIEFLAAGMMSIFLLLMGLFINAPLEELANGNVTPAVAKAPWYFLGLQELLAYFHPTVAGVLTPLLVLVGAALIPYVDRGALTVTRPSERKTAVVLFTLFCALGLILTFVGIFFRGPGYSFVIPYLPFFENSIDAASTSPSEHREGHDQRMSNYHVEPADRPQALSSEAIKSLRPHQVKGISRRQLLRYSIGGGDGRLAARGHWPGTIGFIWPNLSGGFGGKVRIGTLERHQARELGAADRRGLPGLRPGGAGVHRADRSRPPAVRARARTRAATATALNVRALYQRCPHLGCKPNPCLKNFWLECPCHGSRYDRLGIKAAGAQYGPAARSMDRFSAVGRRRRRPDARHGQDHARAAAGRPRPARHHPAADADRLHLMTRPLHRPEPRLDDRRARTRPSRRPSSACRRRRPPEQRLGRAVHGRAVAQGHRRPDAGAQRRRSSASRRAPAGSAS